MPRPVHALLLPLALLSAAHLTPAAAQTAPAGGDASGLSASPPASARASLSLEESDGGSGADPGPLLLPEATLSTCQDKQHLIAINERLQHDGLLHEGDVERISAFISRCQTLLRRDAGLATGPGRHGHGPHDGPHPARGWHRE